MSGGRLADHKISAEAIEAVWQRNTSSFSWHAINLARQFRLEMLDQLALEKGFKRLSLAYTAIVGMVAGRAMRPSELAELLGISKQHCFAMLEEIESVGYLHRAQDPSDKRAKHVVLTAKGERLIAEAIEIDAAISHSYQQILGAEKFKQLTVFISTMYARLDVPKVHGVQAAVDTGHTSPLNGLILGVLADYFEKRIMHGLHKRGFKKLKAMHYQIISYLGVSGMRVSDLADIHNISSQALGQSVKELEAQKFVHRCQDEQDARSKVIVFTERGIALLQACVELAEELELVIMQTVGAKSFNKGSSLLLELASAVVSGPVRSVTRSGQVAIYHPGPGLVILNTDQTELGVEQLLLYLLAVAGQGDGREGGPENLLQQKQGALKLSEEGIRQLKNVSIDPHHIHSVLKSLLGRRELSQLENAFCTVLRKLDA